MTTEGNQCAVGELCVAGLAYFEVFLPPGDVQVDPGEEVFVDRIDLGTGGALNSASVAAALGVDTTLAYPAGQGLGDAAVAHEVSRLGLKSVRWAADDDPAISLIRSADGERSFVSEADFDALSRCPELDSFDWIHVPGLREAAALEPRLRGAQHAGATVSVSGSWAPAELDRLGDGNGDKRPWDMLILNKREATHAGLDALPNNSACDDKVFDLVVTDATLIRARIDGQRYECEVDPVTDPLDTTGAGDAFCAGLISTLSNEASPQAALRRAAAVARHVVQLRGGVVRQRLEL